MNLGLRHKTALVFGGGSGLGRAIAKSLGHEGAKVVVAGRNAEMLEQTVQEIRSYGAYSRSIQWDLNDLASIDAHMKTIEEDYGAVDVLVNSTGGPPPTPAAGQDPDLWAHSFQSMVLPVIAVTDRVLPGMRERKWGRIITSTSSGVVAPIPNLAISNALRLSLVGWSKTLAREVAQDGITTNIVLPGRIATNRIRVLDEVRAKREEKTVEQIMMESINSIPAGRYGHSEEYGDVVTFIASERASYITGSIIRVDGGLISSI